MKHFNTGNQRLCKDQSGLVVLGNSVFGLSPAVTRNRGAAPSSGVSSGGALVSSI